MNMNINHKFLHKQHSILRYKLQIAMLPNIQKLKICPLNWINYEILD